MFVPYEATAALGSLAALKEVFAGVEKAPEGPSPAAALGATQALARNVMAPPAMPVRARTTLSSDE
jgi:hypothetical protein